MRVGLAGPGRWGSRLLRVLHEIPGIDPVVVRRHTWPAALADPGLPAMVLATPTPTHADLAESCLRAGKHVLVEKPLALSAARAAGLERLAEARGLLLWTGHVFVHHPEFRALRAALAGAGGRLAFHGRWQKPVPADRHVGWELLPHPVSIAAGLFGRPPDEVTAEPDAPPGGHAATLHWRPGGTAVVEALRGPPFGWQVRVADYRWTPEGLFTDGGVRVAAADEEPLRAELAAFLDAVRTGWQADIVSASTVVAAVAAAIGPEQ